MEASGTIFAGETLLILATSVRCRAVVDTCDKRQRHLKQFGDLVT